MSQRMIVVHYEASDDIVSPSSDFDAIAGILDALAARFGYNPYAHGFLITRADDARKIEEYIQKNPQDVELGLSSDS